MRSIPDVRPMAKCMKTKMYSYWLCPGSEKYVSLDQISKYAIDAILVSEDGAFYEHNGFDWFEIKETISKNLSQFDYARGGSTITQQLAKNVFLTPEKTIWRKIREAIVTVKLEKTFSKKQILERYLNVIEFGPNVFGIKSAASYYFGKSPSELDVLEGAFLAFVLPNPKTYHRSFVVKNLTPFARKRLATIVDRLMRFKKITREERDISLERLGGVQWLDAPQIEIEENADTPVEEIESIDQSFSDE